MKINNLKPTAAILAIFSITACQKEIQTKTPTQQELFAKGATSILHSVSGSSQTLVLRPGPDDGKDVIAVYDDSDPNTANTNQKHIKEVAAWGWTHFGLTYNTRTFIEFDGLSLIPENATIIKATGYLYGLTSAESTPQGNSYYPGSPYESYGPNNCVVDRVLSAWDESTLTWNNQPSVTKQNESTIASSTSQWGFNAEVDVTEMVKQFVKNRNKNFGVRIKVNNETPYHSIVFGSSDQDNPDLRPKLEVVYE